MSSTKPNLDEYWMERALEEAEQAAREDEVPIGAVAVFRDELIARDHNRTIQHCDPTAHAEVLVLRAIARRIGNYRLSGVTLYTTVEPCAMCAGASIWARIDRLVYGVEDAKGGAVVSKAHLLEEGLFNHILSVEGGILAERCLEPLQSFFRERRRRPDS